MSEGSLVSLTCRGRDQQPKLWILKLGLTNSKRAPASEYFLRTVSRSADETSVRFQQLLSYLKHSVEHHYNRTDMTTWRLSQGHY